MTPTYDAIVLGLGGMGSAACFELARRGRSVLGLEQHGFVHDRGSSHGHTRIIRTAYYEHPDYVPLLRRSWERWYELEQLAGRHLLTSCPCLNMGPADGEVVTGVRRSAREHGLAVEELDAAAIRRRFPFELPDDYAGVMEDAAGFLYVEECVRAHLDLARERGATLHADEPVVAWKVDGAEVEVATARGRYRGRKLVVTAGAWAGELLASVGAPLTVMRQVLHWFDVGAEAARFRRDRFPVFLADVPGGPFYGFPAVDASGLKVARHYGAPELAGPGEVNWDLSPEDEAPVRRFLTEYMRIPTSGGGPRATRSQVCIYTLTPDRHFVIGAHPAGWPVVFACGFSGHGFKFATGVGEALADLADRGSTDLPIGFLSPGRFITT